MDIKKKYNEDDVIKTIVNFCLKQERCIFDVKRKLKLHNKSKEDSINIISELIDKRLINEDRFSKMYCRGKFKNNKWGRIKIVNELKKRNISNISINIGLKEIIEEDYIKCIYSLLNKKLKSFSEKNNYIKKS